MSRFVLDTSVTVAWCFSDEGTRFTEGVLDMMAADSEALVPSVWPLEVANALVTAERRKRISVAQASAFLMRLSGFSISIDPIRMDRAFNQILYNARERKLTAYDAAYLELALREGLPLATIDRDLRHAANSLGLPLLEVPNPRS